MISVRSEDGVPAPHQNDAQFLHETYSLHQGGSMSSMKLLETPNYRHRTMQKDLPSTSDPRDTRPSNETVDRYFLSRTSPNHDSVIAIIAKVAEMEVDMFWDELTEGVM